MNINVFFITLFVVAFNEVTCKKSCIPCLVAKISQKMPLPYYVDDLLQNEIFIFFYISFCCQSIFLQNQIKILNHLNINDYYHINRDKNVDSAFKLIDTDNIR